jgi:hypothetical protein
MHIYVIVTCIVCILGYVHCNSQIAEPEAKAEEEVNHVDLMFKQ